MSENLYTPNCIRTFTGLYMNVFEPTLDMICIEDIAHSLSNQCRFGGHLPEFYSVAQHSIMCSYAVPKGFELQALLHDASEAYLLDMPKPIKNHLTNYVEIEDNLMKLIATKFNFPFPLTKEIKDVDKQMLEWEWDALMLNRYSDLIPPSLSSKKAELMFLERFKEIQPARRISDDGKHITLHEVFPSNQKLFGEQWGLTAEQIAKNIKEFSDEITNAGKNKDANPVICHVNITHEDMNALIRIRNYFGENDKTQLEQLAYDVLNGVVEPFINIKT